jgi:hypothetical protein
MNHPVVSICIPTRNRPIILRHTLESIFSQGVEEDLFEVVVSDNSDDASSLDVCKTFNFSNLTYQKVEQIGFGNSIRALQAGSGQLLKLHNDYSALRPGTIGELVRLGTQLSETMDQILFTNGALKTPGGILRFNSFDSFFRASGHLNTWSSAFSIWKDDLIQYTQNYKFPDSKEFPHTEVLFSSSCKKNFTICDTVLFADQPIAGKVGITYMISLRSRTRTYFCAIKQKVLFLQLR